MPFGKALDKPHREADARDQKEPGLGSLDKDTH